MARVSFISALLLITVGANGQQTSQNLYKVALTQRGYIQFLKYNVQMPALHDFTFCIWVKSSNFSHPHPLFSYSKYETQRLVRSWLQPASLNLKAQLKLEVLEQEVMTVPVDIALGHWYHFCQSWSNTAGQWALHANGELTAAGDSWKTRNLVIPGGGDVVVGQEYTDFDKGLDDGIEGEVFGFNLLTSELDAGSLSLFKTQHNALVPLRTYYATKSLKLPTRLSLRPFQGLGMTLRSAASDTKLIRWPENRRSSGKVSQGNTGAATVRWPNSHRTSQALLATVRQVRDASLRLNPGLELVENSYRQCAAKRGSPIETSRLLVAWASTPVRVFGGAIIKKAKPVCSNF